jgi:polynucleotide 5'-kinase involved in rRNA processing
VQATEDIVQSRREGGSPSVAVVGSKGVGKSTLARLLVNSLLEVSPVVAFLDTDCGQSELTVPGQQPTHTSPLHVSRECPGVHEVQSPMLAFASM